VTVIMSMAYNETSVIVRVLEVHSEYAYVTYSEGIRKYGEPINLFVITSSLKDLVCD
jgi:hypothetical protein